MERDGWIERRPDPADRRAHRLYLKPASSPILAEIVRIGEKARAEALAGLTGEQREQMMNMLEHVRANLVALVSAGEPANSAKQDTRQDDSPTVRRMPTRTTRPRRRKATP
jgi:hypothetical protein